ncbi:type II secretion system protein [Heliorestis acidaminivorans]|uniref:Type II secretion system protein n=1 Tax=Heliorestis acidaminivorans TaxID=553427 RepID=A0A6I0ETZ3_9FIRM|nr:type II secretion system protein [Heliorestis acidaminivorans]KAB2952640.1 type II secretion system protein [Heliorestis acidaminivorans]
MYHLLKVNNEKGATLIEIVIAFTLLSIVMISLIKTLFLGEKLEKYSNEEIKALYLARAILEHKTTGMILDWQEAQDTLPTTVFIPKEYDCEVYVTDVGTSWELKEVTVKVWTSEGKEVVLTSRVSKR